MDTTRESANAATVSDDTGWRLLVRSIGEAGPGLVPLLTRHLKRPPEQVAMLLYRAPSELIGGLPREAAEQLCRLLVRTGLDVVVRPQHEPFDPGGDDYDAALVIRDIGRVDAVAQLVAHVLGIPEQPAREVALGTPAMLLGGISRATVDALRARFAAVGAELDITQPKEAFYDVFLEREASPEAARRILREQRIPALNPPCIAKGLSEMQAKTLWEPFQRRHLPARILSRDFQRYDLVLERAPDTSAMRALLVRITGMPAKLAERAIHQLPLVLAKNETHARIGAWIEEIESAGGQATANLLALQRFSLRVGIVPDPARSIETLHRLTYQAEQTITDALQRHHLPGPFNYQMAHWLQWSLRQIGTEAWLTPAT